MAHVRDRPPAPTSLRPELPAAVDVVFAPGDGQGPRGPLLDLFRLRRRPALGARRRSGRRSAGPIGATYVERPIVVAAVLGLGLVAVAGLAVASGLFGGAGSRVTDRHRAPLAIAPTRRPRRPARRRRTRRSSPTRPSRPCSPSFRRTLASTCVRGGGKADPTAAGWNGRDRHVEVGQRAEPREQLRTGPAKLPPKASLVCTPRRRRTRSSSRNLERTLNYGDVRRRSRDLGRARRESVRHRRWRRAAAATRAMTTWSVGGSSDPELAAVTCIPKAGWDGSAWIYWSLRRGRPAWLRHPQGRRL